ncbi:MAG: PQQ-binding-like beta-propeller repeat protein [Thermoanaerobaculia bacterium]|nr:PQQ-binding-like beta-propeller repeat protein [Thermoanaerobaculia bacterium]
MKILRFTFLFGLAFVALAAQAAEDRGEALRRAAAAGDLAKVQELVAAGVPVDEPTRHGQTALFQAAEKGRLEVVRWLLDKGADAHVRERFFGQSALDVATAAGNPEILRLLLDRGVDGAGDLLYAAVQRGDVELAKLAVATGRIEPLELAAVKRAIELSPTPVAPALVELVGTVVPKARQFPPFQPAAGDLERAAGKYRSGSGNQEVLVTVRGAELHFKLAEGVEVLAKPVQASRYDSADGKFSAFFGGRAGTIEWLATNHEGAVAFLSLAGADLPTLKAAAAPAPEAASRQAARPWPQFRGPGASGIGDGQGAPASWDVAKGDGVRWKTPIPGLGLASPVVWGDRVYLTTAVSSKGDATFRTGLYGDPDSVDDRSEQSFRLYALELGTGKVVWEREVHKGPPGALRHLKSSLANSSPVTDGNRVVVLFGAVGLLVTYDRDGREVWRKEVGILDANDPTAGAAEWGHASSPILYGDLVILQADRRADSYLAAFRLTDGAEVWRVARAEPSTWATPAILPGPNGDELVVNGPIIRGYDPKTGAELWKLGPNSEVVVATPIVGDGLVYVTAGYPPIRPVYAIRPGQRGDLSMPKGQSSSAAIAWSHPRGGTYIPSPILYRGHFHTCNNNGVVTTYDAKTGEQRSSIRMSASGTSFSASPVAADGRLYLFAETGEGYVLASGPEPVLLGTYPMGETVMATPAISDGFLIVRTLGQVVALGG